MKVVLLAGGLGTRMREETEFRPKPMVEIGGKPVLWHIMKLFASHGHKDFVICAGYKGDQIKQYFYNYAASNMDFTVELADQGSAVFHGSHEESDWTVTVADTGLETPTGGRLHKVRRYVGDEPFFCTYGDGIGAVDISALLLSHERSGKAATVTVTKPQSRYGVVTLDDSSDVTGFVEKPTTPDWINIGFFVFSSMVFALLQEDTVLELEPLSQLAEANDLHAFQHSGFWQPMDTYREFQSLNKLWDTGKAPWR